MTTWRGPLGGQHNYVECSIIEHCYNFLATNVHRLITLGKQKDINVSTKTRMKNRPYRPSTAYPRATDTLSSIPIWRPGEPFNDLLRSRKEGRKREEKKEAKSKKEVRKK